MVRKASFNPDGHEQGKACKPFSLRLTEAQRWELEARAGGMPLGEFIRARLFADQIAVMPVSRRPGKPVKDQAALAEVLAKLGRSRLASNMNQLAKAANAGALPVTPETEAALHQACRDIAAMRVALLTALGLKESSGR